MHCVKAIVFTHTSHKYTYIHTSPHEIVYINCICVKTYKCVKISKSDFFHDRNTFLTWYIFGKFHGYSRNVFSFSTFNQFSRNFRVLFSQGTSTENIRKLHKIATKIFNSLLSFLVFLAIICPLLSRNEPTFFQSISMARIVFGLYLLCPS